MDVLLQRVMGRAARSTPPAMRSEGDDRPCGATRAPGWAVNGALWLVLLLVPGSLLLLPALLWWQARRVAILNRLSKNPSGAAFDTRNAQMRGARRRS